METLQIGTITRQVPSTWNELRRKQLLPLLAELYAPERPGRRLRLLALLTGFPLPLLGTQPVVVLAQLLPLTNFLFSEEHLLTAQLLPTIQLAGRLRRQRTWHGPREYLRNLLFGEFMFADTYFVLYSLQQRPEHLDKFLTVLYRPAQEGLDVHHPDWKGDVRQRFNEHQLDARTPRVAQVPAIEKLAILTWYRGCRAQLALEFPDVFRSAEETTDDAKAPDWSRVLRKLSGGAFGTLQQTAEQPLRLILAEMQDAAEEYDRLKNQTRT
ncbi:hypothetical protein Q5H93_23230 [Hymenobacter sp. ASUV-10]|uniref:Uncharacterized protein n=1 Tax=Hymenobacter aranciens TaxID=3063996 RepID=A0ABT9BHD1_9BACT|nr:hypothetical protein [Hymenobacter sp. ASUV-10]MDO7877671.1 hypothetical protein [Hymenobacter sp. ASUV-10]